MSTTNETPSRVFYIKTPEQLMIKLDWEIDNLKNAIRDQDDRARNIDTASYHAFNAAVSAWHIADWMWNSLSREKQAVLAMQMGFKFTDDKYSIKEFQNALVQKSQAIAICSDVANGSKHLDTHKNSRVNAKVDLQSKVATVGEFKSGLQIGRAHV